MSVTTEKTLAKDERPPKPSARALLAFYAIGLSLGLVVALTTRILLGKSQMVVAGFIFTAIYGVIALPILFRKQLTGPRTQH